MKIIGKTDIGYIVHISETEIGITTGFGRYPHYGNRGSDFKTLLAINTEIAVVPSIEYIARISEKIKTVNKTAKELRELADLLEMAIPQVLIPEATND